MEKIIECNKLIDLLEDKRDNLNHTFIIDINLSDSTMKILGFN